MNGYQIITDSTTDLSPALAEELGIEIIPMEITLSGASYLQFPDERALSNRTFYERLASGETATPTKLTPLPLQRRSNATFRPEPMYSILVSLPVYRGPITIRALLRRNSLKNIPAAVFLC